MNSVCLVGRLTKDVELKKTSSGKSVATITLAVKRDAKETDFVPVVVWDKASEYLYNYTQQGSRIEVIGSLQTRKFESNGKNNIAYEVIAKNVSVIDFKESKEEVKEEPKIEYDISDEDVPF